MNEYKGTLSTREGTTRIESEDKNEIMDWLEDRFIEYGIDAMGHFYAPEDDALPDAVCSWSKGDVHISCNFDYLFK